MVTEQELFVIFKNIKKIKKATLNHYFVTGDFVSEVLEVLKNKSLIKNLTNILRDDISNDKYYCVSIKAYDKLIALYNKNYEFKAISILESI